MNLEELNRKGWLQTRISIGEDMQDALIRYAKQLGEPVQARMSEDIVQKLVPVSKESAYPRSLSSIFSTGAFPLHIDTAHWTTPSRYLIFGCVDEGRSIRPTTLLDFNSLQLSNEEKDYLYNSPFIVKNGRNSFYGNILAKSRNFVRYDAGCMIPVNNKENKIESLLASDRVRESLTKIYWEKGMILVVDNWRILHGRGVSIKNGVDRKLYRVLVA